MALSSSASGQSSHLEGFLRTVSSALKTEVSFVRSVTGFSLNLLSLIRILAFSILVTLALIIDSENIAWKILCAIEAVQLVFPALKLLIKQC